MEEIRYDVPFEHLLTPLARHPQGIDRNKPCGFGGLSGVISRQIITTPLPVEYGYVTRSGQNIGLFNGLSGINGNYDLMEMMEEECPWLAQRIPGSSRRVVR